MINSDTEKLYFQMLRIRMIEEEIARRYPEGKMRCPIHLSVGQEAAAVGVCAGLKPGDKMVSTHRGHAHYLAKGGSLNGLIGELYGKSSGCSRGNGGSMHLIDLNCDFWGSTSIVGGTIPVGVGLAFSDRLAGKDHTTVVCIGDAAIEEGVFHESANFASLHHLSVIFLCENNLYSCYTHKNDRQPGHYRDMENVANCHSMKYERCPPNDATALAEIVMGRATYGPIFIEFPTYRHLQHCGPDNDDDLGYRPQSEVAFWRSIDPVKVLHHKWIGVINEEISAAFADAEAAPYPGPEEVGKYVYANN